MKKTKMFIFLIIATICIAFMNCKNSSSGSSDNSNPSKEEKKFCLSNYAKTDFVSVIPEGSNAIIKMEDDSAWSSYAEDPGNDWKGVFLKTRCISLSPYSMCAYEVTQELYEAVMENNPSICVASNDDVNKMVDEEVQKYRPVENVRWYDCIVFCNRLSIKCELTPCYTINNSTNPDDWGDIPTDSNNVVWNAVQLDITANGYRLPTEAEWEFAARGGDAKIDDWKYAYSGVQTAKKVADFKTPNFDKNLFEYGWYKWNLGEIDNKEVKSKEKGYGTHEVGTKSQNRLGLYDMSGNVWEWCWDRYNRNVSINDSAYIENEVVVNPQGSSSDAKRIFRGGAWYSVPLSCFVSTRNYNTPSYCDRETGFRLVRSGN